MKTPPQKPTTPQEVPKSEARDATTQRAATAGDRVTGQSGLSVGKIKWWLGNTELEGVTDVTDSLRRGEDLTSAPRVDDGALLAEWKEALADVIFSRYTVTSETTGWLPALEMPQSATPTTFIRVRIHMKEGLGKGRIVDGVRQIDFYDASKIFEITGGSKSYFDGENLDFYIDPSITPHPVVEQAKLGESKKPGYTGGTMGDAREYFALAAKAFEKGLSVAELDEAIENKLAAKAEATARETTGRTTVEPRPEAAATVRALAGLEHLQKQFASAARLPQAERARIGRQFVAAFERAQRRGVDVDVEMVREARRFLTGYNRRQRAAKLVASPAA